MGLKILSATLGGLVLLVVVDLFVAWYAAFLHRRAVPARIISMLRRLLWALLALLFWSSLVRSGLPDKFTSSYFLFALFVYSLRGLVIAFLPQKKAGRESLRP
ncbi:MAG: hypothetical protein ONB07_09555 [candidate division KSB1 bacterium]|nr:hypothetical protein [candidate division KSB1 bacterium]MDZ7391999.1 hypothetical protein [candidate division KSB1 bacterium]